MPNRRFGGQTYQGHRRGGVAVAAVLVAMPLAVVGALALPPAAPARADPLPTSPDAIASAQAHATGQRVPVAADTTAYTDTVANPNGSFTTTFNERPQHARKNDTWVTPDATLQANSDGSVSPTASVSGLTLSGGGTAPFAVLDDHAGHTMTLRLPFTLPRPEISGATATYRALLPGVDLVATATSEGGVSEVLVIHAAAAAANPALAKLTLSASVTGLNLQVDPDSGATSAINPGTGYPVFGSPPPQMWDSAAPTPAQAQALTQQQHTGPFDAVPAASTPTRPGAAAHVTTIPVTTKKVTANQSQITMAPPASALTGKDVTLPIYVDPPFSVATSPENYVESNHSGTVHNNPDDNLRTGYDDWTTNCGSPCYINHITRSYLWYNINGILPKYVEEAHLQLTEVAASCSGTFTLDVGITSAWVSNPGATALTWSNQPGATSTDPALNSSRSVGVTGDYQVPLTALARHAQNSGWGSVGLVMYMDNESDHCGYRHWALNPQIVATYWSTPNVPASLREVNGTASTDCSTAGHWIPAATNNTINLTNTISTPDVGYPLTSHIYFGIESGTGTIDYSDLATTVTAAPGNNPVSTSVTLFNGMSYLWYTTATSTAGDGHVLTSAAAPAGAPASAVCHFSYDATPPTAPVVTSTAYPHAGPTTVATGGSGTFNLTAQDLLLCQPTCLRGIPSGLASFRYNLNGTSIDAAGTQTVAAASGAYQLTEPLSSMHWGTNVLWVQSKDNAGNVSQPTAYTFYVQQSAFGAYTPGTAGDITGDNHPDLVTVDAAGNIRIFEHPDTVHPDPTGDTGTDPLQYGGRILLPANMDTLWPGASFAGTLVSHAGSFTGHNTDDLILEQNGSLGVAENSNGNGVNWSIVADIPKPACGTCSGYSSTWSAVTQLIAVPTTPGQRPNLLTVEQVDGTSNVWLYTATRTGVGFNPPTQIATYGGFPSSFDNLQIIGAGPLPGSTGTTIWVRDPFLGKLRIIHNIEAGIPDPANAGTTLATSGYDRTSYPLLASVGRADTNGNLPLWTVDSTGALAVVPTTTTTAGTTTLAATGTALSSTNWRSHEQALQNSYQPYNNMGISNDGNSEESSFDNGTTPHSYSVSALANATLSSNVTSACLPIRTTPCPPGIINEGTVTVPQASGSSYTYTLPFPWAHRLDNYQAAGQVIPAPINLDAPPPAGHISFLGAASTAPAAGATGTATVTYTDGHTQQITITLTDWTRGNDAFPLAGGNIVVATCAYRNNVTNGTQDAHHTYLYATAETALLDNGQPVPDGVQIASITLPVNSSIHIFGVAVN
jgi:hypothetical protein